MIVNNSSLLLGRQITRLSVSKCRCISSQVLKDEHRDIDKNVRPTSTDIKPIIGLEVHAQLNLKSKLFSYGSNQSQGASNSRLDLFDVALPGTLPILNKAAIEATILTGLALHCRIQDVIHFDRKNYFYTDMPAGFQITQYNRPIAKEGYIDFIVTSHHKSVIAHSEQYDIVKYLYSSDRYKEDIDPYIKRSQITQLQIEQDSAKTLSQTTPSSSPGSTDELNNLVDYNRSGAALVEIVFEPDLTTGEEASALIKELILILKSIGTCDCELQDGSLRVDANVSIKSIANQDLDPEVAPRVELKNLNSLKALNAGIKFEIQRQASLLRAGERVLKESRTYDSKSGKTIILRKKESVIDYRYVPEPSIPPLYIDQSLIEEARHRVPTKLPSDIREKLLNELNLDMPLVIEIMNEPGLNEYLAEIIKGKQYDSNVVGDFLVYSISNLKNIDSLPMKVDLTCEDDDLRRKLPVKKMQQLFDMLFRDDISFATAYEVIKCLYTSHSDYEPEEIVRVYGWKQLKDEVKVEECCQQLVGGMRNISKKYAKTGSKKYLRMMLAKLAELHKNQISIKKAIYCLNKLLRPHSTS